MQLRQFFQFHEVKRAYFVAIILVLAVTACTQEAENSAITLYAKNQLTFTLPNNWSVTQDTNMPWGTRFINVKCTEASVINIEIFPMDAAGKVLGRDNIDSLDSFVADYRKKSGKFNLLEASNSKPVSSTVNRAQLSGIKETFVGKMYDQDVSYIKEFYKVGLSDSVAYVILDADEKEFGTLNKAFSKLLGSLKSVK